MSALERFAVCRAAEQQPGTGSVLFDILSDGRPMHEILDIDRHNMIWSSNDVDWVDVDRQHFPQYSRLKLLEQSVAEFLGELAPGCQFDERRKVLYRCHCGSDYCGVISAEIECIGGRVYWRHIGYQDDDCLPERGPPGRDGDVPDTVAEWVFDELEYRRAWQDYLAEIRQWAHAVDRAWADRLSIM